MSKVLCRILGGDYKEDGDTGRHVLCWTIVNREREGADIKLTVSLIRVILSFGAASVTSHRPGPCCVVQRFSGTFSTPPSPTSSTLLLRLLPVCAMAKGAKRSKLKAALSPVRDVLLPSKSPPIPEGSPDDEDLMSELMSELDSRDKTVQVEAATVLHDMQKSRSINDSPLKPESPTVDKKDSKSRYKARQVGRFRVYIKFLEI